MNQKSVELPARYDILDALGGGGGGTVMRVFDKFRNEELALKLFNPTGDALNDEESFKAEFLISSAVVHPNLCQVYDFGWDAGNRPFFTMEYINGEELRSQAVRSSKETFLEVLHQLCLGLTLLHRSGLTHNDLKPANVRVNHGQDGAAVKILDFGLAREYDPSRAVGLSGTVEYMAPELFNSEVPSARSDIYSLGILLYELIGGRTPFRSSDPLEVISGHVEEDVPEVRAVLDFINSDTIASVLNMLAKKPENRPESVSDAFRSIVQSLGCDPDGFSDNSISMYFDSALRRVLSRAKWFSDVLDNCKDGAVIGCTDSDIRETAENLIRQHLQTRFTNADLEGSGSSFTAVNAPQAVRIRSEITNGSGNPGPNQLILADIKTYGTVPQEFDGAVIVDGDSVHTSALELILVENCRISGIMNPVLDLFGGTQQVAKHVLSRFQESGIACNAVDGVAIDPGKLKTFELDDQMSALIHKQMEPLTGDEREFISRLSIFSHPFRADLVAEVLNMDLRQARESLDKMCSARVLSCDGETYEFKHPVVQSVQYSRLDPDTRRELHISSANALLNDDYSDKIDRVAWISRHFLLGGNIPDGLEAAVEYQQLEADRGEFVRPEELLSLAETLFYTSNGHDPNMESKLLISMGDMYRAQGKAETALEKYNKVTELKDIEPLTLAKTYKKLGDVYKSRVEFSEGLRSLNKALELFTQVDDRLEISHVLNNMGNIHWINSEYDFALEKYQEALKIQQELDSIRDIASTLSNIGSTYYIKGSHNSAIEYFNRSIELKKQIDDQPEIARTYNNMAVVYFQKGESGRSLNYLNRSLVINRRIGALKEVMFNLENIAEVCVGLGERKRAEEVAAEGLAMARRIEDTPHKGIFSYWLGVLYTERGLYGKAREYLQAALDVSDKTTDKLFIVRTRNLLACNYLLLNNHENAGECLSQAKKVVSPLEFTAEMAQVRLIELRKRFVGGESASEVLAALDAVEGNITNKELRKEHCELLLLKLEILASVGRIPADVLEKFDKLTEIDQHTIYRSYLYVYLGISSVNDKLYNEALSYFDQAEVMAKAFEQRELLWKINFRVGRVFMSQLEYEDAFIRLRRAGDIVKEIALNIGDRELTRSYMKGREVVELLEAVRQLAVKLA